MSVVVGRTRLGSIGMDNEDEDDPDDDDDDDDEVVVVTCVVILLLVAVTVDCVSMKLPFSSS